MFLYQKVQFSPLSYARDCVFQAIITPYWTI